jgi:hypothetical protein
MLMYLQRESCFISPHAGRVKVGPVCPGISNPVFVGGKALIPYVKTLGDMLNQKEIEGGGLPVPADCAAHKLKLFT